MAITGLTDEAVADPMSTLQNIAKALNVPFSDLQIDNYKVLPVVKDKARVLIVEFVNKRTRNSWLVAKKSKRDIFLSDVLSNPSRTKIYINERSTAVERRTLRDAKEYASKNNLKFCWMITGQVFIKKDTSSKRMKYPQDFPTVNQTLQAPPTSNPVLSSINPTAEQSQLINQQS